MEPSYISLKILLLIYKPGCDHSKYDKIRSQYHDPGHCKSLSGRNTTDQMTCLRQRESRNKLSKKSRKFLCGEKRVAKIGHRHNDII